MPEVGLMQENNLGKATGDKHFESSCLTQTVRILSSLRSIFCFLYSKPVRIYFCFVDMTHELMGISGLIKIENNGAQRGARIHHPEIKSLMLYRLS